MVLATELTRALRCHWPYYLAEAAGLACFITSASLLTLTLEHPASPAHQALTAHGVGQLGQRAVLGLGMGLVIVGLTYNPWGKRSGAHINPALTLAFWWLGRIKRPDALWYLVAQALGGIAAAVLLNALLGRYYANAAIHSLTTKPGPAGPAVAFGAEFAISFGFLGTLLVAQQSAQLKKAAGWLAGALLAAYILWETPYSGMSLNPFRSLATAVAAGDYTALWVYLLAPTLGMWLAARLFQWLCPGPAGKQPAPVTGCAVSALPHYPNPAAT